MTLNSIVFILGLCAGSFLNAVIYRLHTGESIITGRSHCPKCGHVLAWYELVPVISFFVQRGKCLECKEKISLQYPLVELGTGVLFVVIFNFQLSIFNEFSNFQIFKLGYLLFVASLLVIIYVYDLKHYIIPDKIIYTAIGIVFIYNFLVFAKLNHWSLIENWKLKIENYEALLYSLLSAILASAFFAAIFFVSRGRWLGFGDVKLAFFMGLFLGWPAILPAIFLAFLLGGIIGIALILAHKKTMKSQVPFGPFLAAGTLISMFWGIDIVNWYKGFLL